jgi:hypothetical protein
MGPLVFTFVLNHLKLSLKIATESQKQKPKMQIFGIKASRTLKGAIPDD